MGIDASGSAFATVFVAELGEKTQAADPLVLSFVEGIWSNATGARMLCTV